MIAAKEVHMYGRDADDTLDWIQEKEGLVSTEDYGHDLESVRTLISKHEGFEVRIRKQFFFLKTLFFAFLLMHIIVWIE